MGDNKELEDNREKKDGIEKEYHFLKEETKKVPANKKKFCKKLGIVILFAAVFGVVASLVFCLLKPMIEKRQAEKAADYSEYEGEQSEDLSSEPEQIIVQETVALSIEEYEALQTQLYSIGNLAGKSVVAINSVTSEKDWFEDDFVTRGESSGVILQTTGSEILILTETDMIADANEIRVTFYGNQKVKATLKAYDGSTGLAVLAVDQKDVSETTKTMISAVEIAGTSHIKPGAFVIGIGSPQGDAFSVVVGNVTSSNQMISFSDKNCKLISTSIEAYPNTKGVLLNVAGQMVGIVCQGEESDALKAISVSDIKGILTKLMAGKRPAYLGVEISEVTIPVSEEYHLPDGVYVKKVDMNSPAVSGGLQVGDVIVKIDGREILTEAQFENCMLNAEPDQKMNVTVKRLGGNDEYHDVNCKVTLGVAE